MRPYEVGPAAGAAAASVANGTTAGAASSAAADAGSGPAASEVRFDLVIRRQVPMTPGRQIATTIIVWPYEVGPAAAAAAASVANGTTAGAGSGPAASEGDEEEAGQITSSATDADRDRGARQRRGGAEAAGTVRPGHQTPGTHDAGRQIGKEAYATPPPPPAPPSRWQEMVGIVWLYEVAQKAWRLTDALGMQEASNNSWCPKSPATSPYSRKDQQSLQ
ncbi:hypothetical protein ACLKA6_019235 [Drosophila palustris]